MSTNGIVTYVVYNYVGVSIGGPPACYIVENHLSRFIEGQVSELGPELLRFHQTLFITGPP